MADNITINPVTTGGSTIATDDISSVHYPRGKLSLGADGTAVDAIGISAALDSTGSGIQAVGIVAQFDDTSPATVTENQFAAPRISSRRALLVEGVTSGTALTVSGTVTAASAAGDTAHDSADAGNPVKVGAKAVTTAFPTAVAASDRANAIADPYGRILTTQIAPGQQVWKQARYTTTQTGAVIWDPTAGSKIAITSIVVGSGGTTAGRLILWFGANADTTYSAGTDMLIMDVTLTPTTSGTPGVVFTPPVPIYATTADHELHATTDANLTVGIAVHGFEFV